MCLADNNRKFNEFRQEFSYFIYERYEYSFLSDSLDLKYYFNMAGKFIFTPMIHIPRTDLFDFKNVPKAAIENIVFHIGLIELISYWKATCPPTVIIKPYKLEEAQVKWWKKLYFLGLGEFFYLNGIDTDSDTFLNIISESDSMLSKADLSLEESVIVPVGGGKDSVVTLELLKEKYAVTPLVINPRQATSQCIQTAGILTKDSIEIFRTIDPLLLELNDQGYLNGHTPFSALLAFLSLLASVLSNKRNIALSNEASANEATVLGQKVNHQYSKSYEFERDFRDYVGTFISEDINYYSFLRPLHEIQIAYIFSKYPQYFDVFKSCNAGSKTDIWCCTCPKCLFAFIILSPFIKLEKLTEIFGENLLDKPSLLSYFKKLTGEDKVKPFECIGTISEINMALSISIKKYEGELPFLLKAYSEKQASNNLNEIYCIDWKNSFNNENFLTEENINIIKHALSC